MGVDPTRLLLYRDLARSELVRGVTRLVDGSGPDARAAYAEVFSRLAALPGPGGDPWRHYVRGAVLTSETPFSQAARAAGSLTVGLAQAMRHDLRLLQRLHDLDGAEIARRLSADGQELPSWTELGDDARLAGTEATLAAAADWAALLEPLWEHFRKRSAGPLGEHYAFRYDRAGLAVISRPDPVRLSELVGYDEAQAALVENTDILALGRRANNALLYGPRGTGKSSTVKALANEYAQRGVRLIQIDKTDLSLFPGALGLVRDRPERFILFIDDLAYELGESDYGHLKGLLEGGLERRPDNVVVYATSNRRNVVDERFGDRDGAGDPVHVTDLYQHKLSLADRFGLRVAFPAVNQTGYLAIVRELAGRGGLEVGEELETEAVRWSLRHNGFSPRTAQHFVDHAAGRAALRGR